MPNRPNHVGRQAIFAKADSVRYFRNRVYHNEPICFSKTGLDSSHARKVRLEAHELLQWMNVDLAHYAQYFDNITAKINSATYL